MDISPSNYLMVEWILIAVCVIVIGARIIVRTLRRMWAFWLSDVLLVIAFLTFLTLVIGDTWTFTRGQNDFNVFYTEGFTKWLFFGDIVYDLGFYFPRFSLLAFYHELFPISEETLRKCSYVIAAYNICAFLATAFIDLFWCGLDVSVNWKHGSSCSLLTAPVTLKINWTLGVVAELLVFILPFGVLRRLKATPRRDKIALACLFAIGFASILATVARLVFGILAVSSLTTYVIGSTEIATQIVVVGLPALRPLLSMIPAGWNRLYIYCTQNRSQSGVEKESIQVSCSTEASKQLKDGTLRRDTSDDVPDIEIHWPDEDGAHGGTGIV